MKKVTILLSLLCVTTAITFVSCKKKTSTTSDNSENIDDVDEELIPNSQIVSYDNAVYINFSDTGVTFINSFESSGVSIQNTNGHVVVNSTITDKEINYILSGIISEGSIKIYGSYKFGLVLNGTGITNSQGAAINIQCSKKITVTVVDNTNNRLIDNSSYTFVDGEDMKATFFSEGQLNFYGEGKLEVRGKYKHAICTDDYFRMYAGNIIVKEAASDAIHANGYIRIDDGSLTLKSVGEGIESEKEYVVVNGGNLSIKTTGSKGQGIKSLNYITINSGNIDVSVSGIASKGFSSGGATNIKGGIVQISTTGSAVYVTSETDFSSAAGIKCDGNMIIDNGTITINSSGSGGKGISVDSTLTINGGTITVTTTGSNFVYGKDNTAAKAIKSDGKLTINGGYITVKTSQYGAEGLESKDSLIINDGTIEVEAYDDCINASKHITINGGNIYCYSSDNDGFDSNGTLTITGGVVVSSGTKSPEEGFDCDNNTFKITGGIVIGTGGATSSPSSSVSTQRSLVYGASSVSANQIIYIESESGTQVLAYKVPRTYSSMTLLFSSPNLVASTKYTIYKGGSISGGSEFHGLYTGATYTKGTSATSFNTTSMVTTAGNSTSGAGGR